MDGDGVNRYLGADTPTDRAGAGNILPPDTRPRRRVGNRTRGANDVAANGVVVTLYIGRYRPTQRADSVRTVSRRRPFKAPLFRPLCSVQNAGKQPRVKRNLIQLKRFPARSKHPTPGAT
ncbi:hypothetical protein LSAT2_031870 [Lamellibrachia satsuma]|nr:hypothetical protein LSAT2_031870 [Lamellibrachia satsuma]